MKKTLIAVLCMLLMASVLTVALAVPSNVQYSSTRAFLEILDSYNLNYNYTGIDQQDDEGVRISLPGDNVPSVTVRLFFGPNGDECSLRAWNVIDYNASDYQNMLELVNSLNYKYRWVRFYCDTTDDSLTVAADVSFIDANAGDISAEALVHIVNIIDDCWSEIAPHAK